MIYFKITKTEPTGTKTTIVPKLFLEQATILISLLEQRFETDIRISIALGETSEEEGNNLIENTIYSLEKI